MTPDARLDRQLRIPGWNQQAIEEARIVVFGDDDLLASLYVLSAAALGFNRIVLMAPRGEDALLTTARRVNPRLRLGVIEGYYTHPMLEEILRPCAAIVDLTQYALANKLLLEEGFRSHVPVIRGLCQEQNGEEEFKVFVYRRGREWEELRELVSPHNLPAEHFDDGVLDIVAAGIALEETKNVVMGQRVSEDVIVYRRPKVVAPGVGVRVCVVGAGALGNFVGLGLAYAGVRNITVIDPDEVEVTNLNRQVFFADGVGRDKAALLCEKLNTLFGTNANACPAYFQRSTDVSEHDAVFDCVDNFETRILLSERCRDQGKVLISGGTGAETGQVVVYDPARGGETPAELLGLYDVVNRRQIDGDERGAAACAYRPEPSVIMVNQVIAGLMVDAYRRLLGGQEPANIFYDSTADKRL